MADTKIQRSTLIGAFLAATALGVGVTLVAVNAGDDEPSRAQLVSDVDETTTTTEAEPTTTTEATTTTQAPVTTVAPVETTVVPAPAPAPAPAPTTVVTVAPPPKPAPVPIEQRVEQHEQRITDLEQKDEPAPATPTTQPPPDDLEMWG